MSVNPYESPQGASPAGRSAARKVLYALAVYVAPAGVLLLGLFVFLLPEIQRISPKAQRTHACYMNMRIISLALSNYHEKFGEFPPAYTTDSEGKPLHSWRTLILPYVGQEELYDRIDLSKPWDDPANIEACTTVVYEYRCPAATKKGDKQYLTTYLACVGNDLAIHPTRGRKTSEITDGTTNTLLFVEVLMADAVPWASPQDASEEQVVALVTKIKEDRSHSQPQSFVYCDTHHGSFYKDLTSEEVRSLLTIAAGDNQEVAP